MLSEMHISQRISVYAQLYGIMVYLHTQSSLHYCFRDTDDSIESRFHSSYLILSVSYPAGKQKEEFPSSFEQATAVSSFNENFPDVLMNGPL